MTEKEKLQYYCQNNDRVCPMPHKWNELYKLLPNREKKGVVDTPPAPLILAGWNYSNNLQKMHRLQQHIEWADESGVLENLAEFVYSLKEEEWFHLKD